MPLNKVHHTKGQLTKVQLAKMQLTKLHLLTKVHINKVQLTKLYFAMVQLNKVHTAHPVLHLSSGSRPVWRSYFTDTPMISQSDS